METKLTSDLHISTRTRNTATGIETDSIQNNTQGGQLQHDTVREISLTTTLNLILTREVMNELTILQQININTSRCPRSNKSNQNSTKTQGENNKFKRTNTPLIVACYCLVLG
jgi:hypothetical protein